MSIPTENIVEWIIGFILILSSLGVIIARNPVHSSLCFLLTLLSLAALYLQLSAEFIAIIQILVYAGAILVIFMFVVVLFQDAHKKMESFKPKSSKKLLSIAGLGFILAMVVLGSQFKDISYVRQQFPLEFGTAKTIGLALYIDYFFPFEAVTLLFLVALVGSLYIAKKET